ncbi:YbbR-like domain-containing protein, partial [Chloroflexota bacterium]
MLRSTAFGRFITANIAWLISSLLLAIFVWIAAVNEQNPVESHRYSERIPVDILIDEGMLVTNNPVSSVQLILRTTAEVWDTLTPDTIAVTANLTGQTPGTYTTDLAVDFQSASRIIVENIQPEQIIVALDQGAEKLVPIQAEVRTPPPTGFEVLSTSFSTQEALISGIASEVERVAAASVRLHLNDETNTYTRNYRLFAVDDEGATISNVIITPETVDVFVEIEPGADYREVFVVPTIVGEPAEGYVVVSITYDPQTVLVSGRPSELEQLPGTIQTTPIDLTGETGSFTRTVS